jgi:hypothetical protein
MKAAIGSNVRVGLARVPRIGSYAELQEQLHRDLLAQHPEWIQPDGNCPKCDDYDRRLAELISFFRTGSLDSVQRAA